MAEANGRWDYLMVDDKQKLTVNVNCNHQAITAENVIMNGRPRSFKMLLDAEGDRLFAGTSDYLNRNVPEIDKFSKEINTYSKENKVNAKLIYRLDNIPDPTSSNRYEQLYVEIYVGADMETHTSRWNTFLIRSDFKEILVEDPASPELTYLSLAEWRRRAKEEQ